MNIQIQSIESNAVINKINSEFHTVNNKVTQLETIEKDDIVAYNAQEGKFSSIGGDAIKTIRQYEKSTLESITSPLAGGMQKIVSFFQKATPELLNFTTAIKQDIDTALEDALQAVHLTDNLDDINKIKQKVDELKKKLDSDTIKNAFASIIESDQTTKANISAIQSKLADTSQKIDREVSIARILYQKNPQGQTRIEVLNYIASHNGSVQAYDVLNYEELKTIKYVLEKEAKGETLNQIEQNLLTKLPSTTRKGFNDAYASFSKKLKDFKVLYPKIMEPGIKDQVAKEIKELETISLEITKLKIAAKEMSPTEFKEQINKLFARRAELTDNLKMIVDAKNFMKKLVSEEGEGSWLDVFSFTNDPELKGFAELEAASAIQHKLLDEMIIYQIWKEHQANMPKTGEPLKVVIEGAGPHGLLAGVELFLSGANVSVVNDRGERYVRNQIVDLDPKWAMNMRYLLGTKFDELFVGENALGSYEEGHHSLSINTKSLEDALKERSVEIAAYVAAREVSPSYNIIYEAVFKEASHPSGSSSYVAILDMPAKASPDVERFNQFLLEAKASYILEKGEYQQYESTDKIEVDGKQKTVSEAAREKAKKELIDKKADEILAFLDAKYPQAKFKTDIVPTLNGKPVFIFEDKPQSIRQYAELELAKSAPQKTVSAVAQEKTKKELIDEKADEILASLEANPQVKFDIDTLPVPTVNGKPVLIFEDKPQSIKQYAELEWEAKAPQLRELPRIEFDFLACCGGVRDSIRDMYLGATREETIPKSYGVAVLTKGDKFKKEKFLPEGKSGRVFETMQDLKPHLQKQNFEELLQIKLKTSDGKETGELLLPENLIKKYENLTEMILQGLEVDIPSEKSGLPPLYKVDQSGKFILASNTAEPNTVQLRMFENNLTFYVGAETPPAISEFLKEVENLKKPIDSELRKLTKQNMEQDKERIGALKAKSDQLAELKKSLDQKWFTALSNKFIQASHPNDHSWEEIINPKRGKRNLDPNKLNFDINDINTGTFPVIQSVLDKAAIQLEHEDAALIVTALGDSRASPHFFSGSGLSTGRLGVDNTAILIRDYHKGKEPLVSREELVKQLDNRLDQVKLQVIEKGGRYVKRSPEKVSDQKRREAQCTGINTACDAIHKEQERGNAPDFEIIRKREGDTVIPITDKAREFKIRIAEDEDVPAEVTQNGNIKCHNKEYPSVRIAAAALKQERLLRDK